MDEDVSRNGLRQQGKVVAMMMKAMDPATHVYDTFPLGAGPKAIFSMDTRRTQVNNNTLVVGGTGAGKTIGVAYPILMHLQHGNAVGIFTKRGMTDSIRQLLEKRGYHIYEIDFCHPETSPFGYDPLKHCLDDTDLMALSHSIIWGKKNENDIKEPFWNNSAESLLLPVLRYVHNGLYREGSGLLDAVKLLDSIPSTSFTDWRKGRDPFDMEDGCYMYSSHDCRHELEQPSEEDLWEKYEKEGKDVFEEEDQHHRKLLMREIKRLMDSDARDASAWEAYINGANETRQSVMMTLQTPLMQVFTHAIRSFLQNPREFSFEKLLEPKTVLFVYTSPVNAALGRFISIFYQQMFKCLFELAEKREDGTLPYPVYVICDDFATGVPIDHFQDHISIFRAKGISVTMLIQSETQLASLYGSDNAKTIINNCDTYIYLGGMDILTAKAIAERIEWPYSDVLNLEIGRELLFRRGQKPLSIRRYDLFRNPLYAECQRMGKIRQ